MHTLDVSRDRALVQWEDDLLPHGDWLYYIHPLLLERSEALCDAVRRTTSNELVTYVRIVIGQS